VAGRDHHQRRRDQSRRREERLERVLSQGKKEDYARQAVIRRVTSTRSVNFRMRKVSARAIDGIGFEERPVHLQRDHSTRNTVRRLDRRATTCSIAADIALELARNSVDAASTDRGKLHASVKDGHLRDRYREFGACVHG
jgi:hypothetical protein